MAGFNENVLILFAKYKEFHLDERSFICGKRSCFFLLSLLLTAFPQTEVSAQETKILPGNLEMARRMVPQGAVLLRNESDVLPLPHGERVAVFGSGQLAFQPGGGGGRHFLQHPFRDFHRLAAESNLFTVTHLLRLCNFFLFLRRAIKPILGKEKLQE